MSCPFDHFFPNILSKGLGYLHHAVFLEYILGQDEVSCTRTIIPPFLVSK